MNINVLVDSLMVYAQENLLLDDLDLIYARNQIISKLKLTDYEEYEILAEMVEGMQSPYQILNQISDFAVSSGVIKEAERTDFEAELMTYLLKRPSEIADTFCDLIEKGKSAKAYFWLNEYNIKSGFIKPENIIKHWEARGTKGKIEIFITKNLEPIQTSGYLPCEKCVEIEGISQYRLMRRAPILLADTEYLLQFAETPYTGGLCYVINQIHEPSLVDAPHLERMFDLLTFMPNFYVSMEESEAHDHFICGTRLLPIHKAPDLRKLKSQEYPYISISEIDWYTNALRISCTNKEKLIEFTGLIVDKFKGLDSGNRVSLTTRKLEKFVIDIYFENTNLAISKKNESLLAGFPDFLARMGIFSLHESLNEEIAQMDLYLTKEAKFSEATLSENMLKHKATIMKILKEIGTTKISSVEAQIDIKEEINNICESALADICVFKKTQEGSEEFAGFLASIGIK